MTPYLHFYVNLRKDKEYVRKYFPLFRKILGKKNFENMLETYEKARNLKILKKEMERIEERWRGVEKKFFDRVEKKFGKWKRKKYFCHVSSTYLCGGGYEYPTIIIFPFSKHLDPLKTIMHELLHLHLIEDVKRFNLKPKKWIEFSEIAVAFMSKKLKLPLLFPNEKIEKKFKRMEKCWKRKIEWKKILTQIEKHI